MLTLPKNPEKVVLYVVPQNVDGSPKTVLLSAKVRVYYVDQLNAEHEVLTEQDLIQIPSSYVWRYVWQPSTLDNGHYIAQYSMIDDDSVFSSLTEDIIITTECDTITVEEIDDKLTEEHGEGPWTSIPGSGPDIIPG
jgi:hypothetical protein